MRRTIIAGLIVADALVFCGIVRFSLQFADDLRRPHLAARTMTLIARTLDATQRELASVGTQLRLRDG